MAEFNLHVRLDSAQTTDVESLFEPYVDDEDVSIAETDDIEPARDPDIHTPRQFLEIEGIERFVEIYTDLEDRQEVATVSLWGPTADRYPIPVEHYALQQIGDPKLYEFHALDGQTTLVIAESQMELDRIRQEVPAGARG